MNPFWINPEFQSSQPRGCDDYFFAFNAGILPLANPDLPFVGGKILALNPTAPICSGSIVIPEQHTPQGTTPC
jgi:hypothetical protein